MPRTNAKSCLTARPAPAPWTASRCKRTLRQLTSFVNRLERWHKAFLAAQEAEGAKDDIEEEEQEADTDEAPDWLASHTTLRNKRPKKKYSSRRTTAPKTPLSKRRLPRRPVDTPRNDAIQSISVTIERQTAPQPGQSQHATRGVERCRTAIGHNGDFSREWSPSTAHLAQEHGAIIQQGWSTVTTFLVVTSDPELPLRRETREVPPRLGARSLYDMSLDSASRHTVEQQKENESETDGYEGQQDILGSYLQQLEDLFGDPKSGWPSLRKAVRACGIHLITRITKSGALRYNRATQLVSRCRNPSLGDFRQAMSLALVEAHSRNYDANATFYHIPDDSIPADSSDRQSLEGSMPVLLTLRQLQEAEDPASVIDRSIRYRHLRSHLELYNRSEDHPNLPVPELLETVFVGALSPWGWMDRRGPLRGGPPDTKRAYGHVMSKALWGRLKATLNLILSFCGHAATSTTYTPIIERMSKKVQALVELDIHSQMSYYQLCLAAHIFFGSLFQRLINGCGVDAGLLTSLDTVISYECLSTVLGGVIAAILCMSAESGTTLQHFLEQLLALDCKDYRNLSTAVAKIGAGAAQEYTMTYPERYTDERWAEDISEKFQAKLRHVVGRVPRTPSLKLQPTYLWDATIAEWVAETPQASQSNNKKKLTTSRDQICAVDRSGNDQELPIVRPALAPLSGNIATMDANRKKRKSAPTDLETHWDDDFQYKKVKRFDLQKSPRTTPELRAQRLWADDGSDDELSLLE
nr:hypothetical protein LTR18_007013 [Exophiala xenobiotica]